MMTDEIRLSSRPWFFPVNGRIIQIPNLRENTEVPRLLEQKIYGGLYGGGVALWAQRRASASGACAPACPRAAARRAASGARAIRV